MRRAVVGLIAAVVLALAGSTEAQAGVRDNSWTDGQGVGTSVGVDDNTSGSTHNGGGSSSAPVCTYNLLTGDDAAGAESFSQTDFGPTKGTGPGAWYRQICIDAQGRSTGIIMWIAQAVDPVALAQQAMQYSAIAAPKIVLSPSADSVQIVGLQMWLSVDPATWKPVTATATAGGVTVTATATPVHIAWNTGDGSTTTCAGPGSAYDPNKSDVQQHSDCTHTYTRSSAGSPNNSFTLTATQTWNVTWTAVGAPAGTPVAGALDAVTRQTTLPIRVGEVQTLNQRR